MNILFQAIELLGTRRRDVLEKLHQSQRCTHAASQETVGPVTKKKRLIATKDLCGDTEVSPESPHPRCCSLEHNPETLGHRLAELEALLQTTAAKSNNDQPNVSMAIVEVIVGLYACIDNVLAAAARISNNGSKSCSPTASPGFASAYPEPTRRPSRSTSSSSPTVPLPPTGFGGSNSIPHVTPQLDSFVAFNSNGSTPLPTSASASARDGVSRDDYTILINQPSATMFGVTGQRRRSSESPQTDSLSIANSVSSFVGKKPVHVSTKVRKSVDVDGSRMINQYILLQEIGRGSFGKVSAAFDTLDERMVAMKTIRRIKTPKFGQSNAADLLQKEIDVMKRIRHKNLVSLFEVIDDQKKDKMYLALEYVDDGCLATQRGELHWRTEKAAGVLDIARQAATGLEYLHNHGIVHRDIKPENMLLDKDGRLCIADFGVAAVTEEEIMGPTQGTQMFMAPELTNMPPPDPRRPSFVPIEGEESDRPLSENFLTSETQPFVSRELYDIRRMRRKMANATDIWALGITLYQVFYRSLPFENLVEIRSAEVKYPALRETCWFSLNFCHKLWRLEEELEGRLSFMLEDPGSVPDAIRSSVSAGRFGKRHQQEEQLRQLRLEMATRQRLAPLFQKIIVWCLQRQPSARPTARELRFELKRVSREIEDVEEEFSSNYEMFEKGEVYGRPGSYTSNVDPGLEMANEMRDFLSHYRRGDLKKAHSSMRMKPRRTSLSFADVASSESESGTESDTASDGGETTTHSPKRTAQIPPPINMSVGGDCGVALSTEFSITTPEFGRHRTASPQYAEQSRSTTLTELQESTVDPQVAFSSFLTFLNKKQGGVNKKQGRGVVTFESAPSENTSSQARTLTHSSGSSHKNPEPTSESPRAEVGSPTPQTSAPTSFVDEIGAPPFSELFQQTVHSLDKNPLSDGNKSNSASLPHIPLHSPVVAPLRPGARSAIIKHRK